MNRAQLESYQLKVEALISDPEVATKMSARRAGIEILLFGNASNLDPAVKPMIIAGMRLTPEELDLLVVAVGNYGQECIYVGFQADDIDGIPAIAVLVPQGDNVLIEGQCALWAANDTDRGVIVPVGDDGVGQYLIGADANMSFLANRPAKNLDAGRRRAWARVRKNASSVAALHSLGHTTVNILQNEGMGEITNNQRPLSEQ